MKFPKFRKRNEGYEEDYEGYYGDEGYYDDDVDAMNDDMDDDVVEESYTASNKSTGAAFEMKIITPKSYDDREEIARCLVNGNAVFLNIEALTRDSIIRLMDYLGGVIYVIEGKVKWSNSSSVIFAPKNVNISGIDEEEEEVEETVENEAEEDYIG